MNATTHTAITLTDELKTNVDNAEKIDVVPASDAIAALAKVLGKNVLSTNVRLPTARSQRSFPA